MGSPSVTITERTLETLPIVEGSFTCVIIGTASKGRLEEVTLVPSFTYFKEKFGNKISTNEKAYFAIKKLYENTSNIYFARAGIAGEMALANKVVEGTIDGVSDTYDVLTFSALSKGTDGNLITARILKLASISGEPQGYTVYIDYNGVEVENYKNVNITDPTSERYIEKIINDETSRYVEAEVDESLTYPSGKTIEDVEIVNFVSGNPVETSYTLEGGSDGDDVTNAELITSVQTIFSKLEDRDSITFDTILFPDFQTAAINSSLESLANSRNDFLGIIDVPMDIGISSDPVGNAIDFTDGNYSGSLNLNNKQLTVPGYWIKDYDDLDKTYKWFPMSIFIADILAQLARNSVIWQSVAGLDNGKLSAVEVQYSPTKPERDLLYGELPNGKVNVFNPVVDFETDGLVLWGQRTTLRNELKATNRINVVVMLNFLKQKLYKLGRKLQFKINSPESGTMKDYFNNNVKNILSYIKSKEGCENYSYEAIDDPIARANNKFVAKISIVPTSIAEDIEFILEVTPQTVEIK